MNRSRFSSYVLCFSPIVICAVFGCVVQDQRELGADTRERCLDYCESVGGVLSEVIAQPTGNGVTYHPAACVCAMEGDPE